MNGGAQLTNFLFEESFYLQSTPDALDSGLSPFKHYLQVGAAQFQDPHPLFDTRWYLAQNPDVAAAGMNPLLHFAKYGDKEGRNPHPLFDGGWMRQRYSLAARTSAMSHFLDHGRKIDPHPLFDTLFYLDRFGDSIAVDVIPLVHYLLEGGYRGWSPHPTFNGLAYLKRYPDVANASINPLVHYVVHGAAEGRASLPA